MDPVTIATILSLVLRYGPTAVSEILAVLHRNDATLDDVAKVLATVKPYEAYGIPDVEAKT